MSSEITKSILIDAPASVIFKALTDEKELVQWMPRRAKMEARVGGEYEFNFYRESNRSETVAKGKIVELVPNRKLVYTFVSSLGQSGVSQTLLTWTLEEESSGKTLVTRPFRPRGDIVHPLHGVGLLPRPVGISLPADVSPKIAALWRQVRVRVRNELARPGLSCFSLNSPPGVIGLFRSIAGKAGQYERIELSVAVRAK